MTGNRHKAYTDVFIDFDDTLCDTHGNADLALREVYADFGLGRWFSRADIFYDSYWRANIELWQRYGRGEVTRDYLIVERFRRPLSMADRSDADSGPLHIDEQLCLKMSDHFLDCCATKPGVVDGAHELVDHLRSRGYRLHLCSNGFHEVQYRKLHSCGFDGCFDSIILSEDAGVNKPAAAFFDYAFSISHAVPQTTVMVGDSWESDISGARAYGLDTIYFNRFPDYPAPEPVTHEVHSLREIMNII